jgi:uncharacterized protein HemX
MVFMTPENDEDGDPRDTLASPAPAATATARDALRAGTVVPVALGLMLGIGYLGYANVQRQIKAQHAELETLRDTQHAELETLKDKIPAAHSRTDVEQSQPSTSEIQGLQNHVVPATHSRTDVEQSQPSTSEIQGLQNHVETLRGQAKRQRK